MVLLPVIASATPVKLIIDTDMDTDCDDAGALAMAHALHDLGEIELLATVCATNAMPYSVGAIDVINTYYGRPDLPIGSPKGTVGDPRNGVPGTAPYRGSRYAEQLTGEFPHDLTTALQAPDAVQVYRRVLAAQPDQSVTLVSIGYLTNFMNLLQSLGDEFSPLDGHELVAQKVVLWVNMGGRFPELRSDGVWGNWLPDPDATQYSINHWPTPIVFAGQLLGDPIKTGAGLNSPERNPVARAYQLFFKGEIKSRSSWDQMALLYAARPRAPYWRTVTVGSVEIFPNGSNRWRLAPDRDQSYLLPVEDPREVEEIIENLMVSPPRTRNAGRNQ